MIPSDHFVRFYNEVFKFLEAKGESHLQSYWLAVSRNQELTVLDLFREKGFEGMREYWSRIAYEENCEMEFRVLPDCLWISMNKCPSLTKAMDNDAGLMPRYCDHCPGWIGPILEKLGYYLVFDVIDREQPRCEMMIFNDPAKAEEAREKAKLPLSWPRPEKY